jgi:hypothetical protein
MAGNVAEAARGEGIAMDFDRALAANTLAAHRLLRLAEHEYGPPVQHSLAEQLFEAHFARGADIGDPAVLTALAIAAGMDGERVRGYLASDEGVAEGRARSAMRGSSESPRFPPSSSRGATVCRAPSRPPPSSRPSRPSPANPPPRRSLVRMGAMTGRARCEGRGSGGRRRRGMKSPPEPERAGVATTPASAFRGINPPAGTTRSPLKWASGARR